MRLLSCYSDPSIIDGCLKTYADYEQTLNDLLTELRNEKMSEMCQNEQ